MGPWMLGRRRAARLGLALAVGFALLSLRPPSARADSLVTLTGHVPKKLSSAVNLGHAPADENVHLSLVLRLDQNLMDQTLAQIYSQPLAKRHYLTPDEVAQKFGLAEKRQAIKDFAAANGLTLSPDDNPHSLIVHATGRVDAVERAFHVRLDHFRLPDGHVVRGPESDPQVPASLAGHLQSVLGLSNIRSVRPHLRRPDKTSRRPSGAGATAAKAAASAGRQSPEATEFSGNSCGDFGTCMSPTDVNDVYSLGGAVSHPGSGQTVGLIEYDGYAQTDIDAYESAYSLPANTPNFVSVDSTPNKCGVDSSGNPSQDQTCDFNTYISLNGGDGAMQEVALDIEMVLAVAPNATIDVYTVLNNPDVDNPIDPYDAAISADNAKVISTSWGNDEEATGTTFMGDENTEFQVAATQGQTIFSAAGDYGAYDGIYDQTPITSVITDDPASQPYVTGVGGTGLTGNDSSHSEFVWNSGGGSDGLGPGCTSTTVGEGTCEGGGGGIADYGGDWSIPSWQSGAATSDTQFSSSYRNVPDVSLNADPNYSPYDTCVGGSCNCEYTNSDNSNCPSGYTCSCSIVGGTSAAAPLWAAFTALANQEAGSSLGFLNPTLYSLAKNDTSHTLFTDVTTGNPENTTYGFASDFGNGAYNAYSGYDNASGWGSFKGGALLTALTSAGNVTNITATAVGNDIEWTWSAAQYATSYDLYYASNTASKLANVTTTSLTKVVGPNYGTELSICGVVESKDGPCTISPYAATLAQVYPGAGQSAPSVQVAVTSITVSYSGCSGLTGGCSGFEVDASPNANFSSPVYSAVTTNSSLLQQTVTGLTANTAYYIRVGNLNPIQVSNPSSGYGPYTTQNSLVEPVAAPFSNLSPSQIQANWATGGNQFGTYYRARIYSNSTFTAQVGSDEGGQNVTSALYTGLSPGTSYWFSVTPQIGLLSGTTLYYGPQATETAEPTAAATPMTSPAPTQMTVNWAANGNGGAANYQVELSSASNFSLGPIIAQTSALTATISGLSPNVRYYGRVQSLATDGTTSAFLSLGSKATQAAPPTLQAFTGQTAYGFTANYTNGGNGSPVSFEVQIANNAGFSPVQQSVDTSGLAQGFSFLTPNTQYWVQVAGVNSDGLVGSYSASLSTFTVPAPPGSAASLVTGRTTTSITVAWGQGANPAATSYLAELHAAPDYSDPPLQTVAPGSGVTAATFNAGLSANSSYYVRVEALGQGGNAPSAFTPFGEAATLTPPLPSAPTIVSVTYSSATLSWTPIANCEGYRVDASTDAQFTGTLYTNLISGANVSQGGVSGLPPNTVVFLRVGPADEDGASNPTAAASSTMTLYEYAVTGVVGGSGVQLSTTPVLPPLTGIQVSVPAGAFPSGTSITLNTSVNLEMPPPTSNEAQLVSLGQAAGFELLAGGAEPSLPVPVSFTYDPALLPPGVDPSTIQLARWDDASGQWTLIPTTVNTGANSVSAELNHFSLYAVFGVNSAAALSDVNIFPIPWEINTSDPRFSAQVLTISNLPADARVRIFDMAGELIWESNAQGNGILTWSGSNRFGREAGSGTYLVVIDGGGQRVVKRAVIVR